MDEATYRALQAMNWSTLSVGRNKSLLHMKYAIEHGREDNESFAFGRVGHILTLQPEKFDEEFFVWSGADRRTKDGKAEYAEALEESGTRELVTCSDWMEARKLADAVHGNQSAAELLSVGEAERVLVWNDADTGLTMKGRADYINAASVVDLKTTKSADPKSFSEASWRYGYHAQLALYIDGALATDGIRRNAIIIAVESSAPYAVQVYRLPEELIAIGRSEYRRILNAYALAKKTGIWPGYSDGPMDLTIPEAA